MKCPHCSTSIHFDFKEIIFPIPSEEDDDYEGYSINYGFCPACDKLIIELLKGDLAFAINNNYLASVEHADVIYPKFPCGLALSEHIPKKYADLYTESEQVNNISPRASATLSRYLLQMVLHEELNIRKKNLELEIQELETKANVPSTLIAMLQVMRRVANFGAHPKKSENSAEIVEIEPGEAEIMLEVIRELFDHVFVKPAQQQEALQRIEEKFGIKCEA